MADINDLNAAWRSKLQADAILVALLASDSSRIYPRTAKTPDKVPCLTYTVQDSMPEALVPLHDIIVSITAWGLSGDTASAISSRVREVLHKQPLTVSDSDWRFQGIYATAGAEEEVEDGDRVGNTQSFRLLAYEVG